MTHDDDELQLYKLSHAARLLSVSTRTLERMAEQGQLRIVTLDGNRKLRRVPAAEIRRIVLGRPT